MHLVRLLKSPTPSTDQKYIKYEVSLDSIDKLLNMIPYKTKSQIACHLALNMKVLSRQSYCSRGPGPLTLIIFPSSFPILF